MTARGGCCEKIENERLRKFREDRYGKEMERPSTELGAVRRKVDRIEGRRSANEQAVELGAAESYVRDHLGNEDFADQRAVDVMAMDALCGARPNAAIPIDAKTVEQARRGLREDLAAR